MHAPNSWVIEGFTTDALMAIGAVIGEILSMRKVIHGGLSDAEERLLKAIEDV